MKYTNRNEFNWLHFLTGKVPNRLHSVLDIDFLAWWNTISNGDTMSDFKAALLNIETEHSNDSEAAALDEAGRAAEDGFSSWGF